MPAPLSNNPRAQGVTSCRQGSVCQNLSPKELPETLDAPARLAFPRGLSDSPQEGKENQVLPGRSERPQKPWKGPSLSHSHV